MKKTLIALAAVAVTSTAFAQNVTISGRVDMGTVSSTSKDTNTAKAKGTAAKMQDASREKASSLAGAHGSYTGSRITFAGTEDLGGGLTAFFNAETSLNNSVIGNRNLFVGLRGDFGSVQLGRSLNALSAIRDSHYSVAGAPGGAFLNLHVGNAMDGESAFEAFGAKLSGFNTESQVRAESTGALITLNDTIVATLKAKAESGSTTPLTDTNTGVAAGDVAAFAEALGLTTANMTTAEAQAALVKINAAEASRRATNAARAAELGTLLSNGMSGRSDRALSYTTPDFNGFTASVGLVNEKLDVLDQNKGAKAKTDRTQASASGQLYSLAYASGPLSARLTVGSSKITTQSDNVSANDFRGASAAVGESKAKASDQALMVSYDFGMAQAYVMHNNTKGTLTQWLGKGVSGAQQKTSATEIGVKMPMGSFAPFVTIGRGDMETTAADKLTGKADTSAWQIGTTYNLSPRTFLYAATGNVTVKSKYDYANKRAQNFESKTTGYAAGLVHNF